LMQRRGERKDVGPAQPLRNVERTIELGEEVVVTPARGEFVTLQLKFHESAACQLLKSVYRPPVVYLKAITASGAEKEYRLIPEITEAPFLLTPLVQDQPDFASLYARDQPERIVKFSITANTQWGMDCYDSRLQMKLSTFRLPIEE
jgi:hypothetical protein